MNDSVSKLSKERKQEWCERLNSLGSFWHYEGGSVVAQLTLSAMVTDYYFNSTVLLSEAELTRQLCSEVFIPEIAAVGLRPSFILTFAPFGMPLATILSLEMKLAMGYVTTAEDSKLSRLPSPLDESIIVTDDIWSGTSVRRIIRNLQENGRKDPSCIVVIGNCSRESSIDGIPILSLFHRPIQTWALSDFPLSDQKEITPLNAREHWTTLVPHAYRKRG